MNRVFPLCLILSIAAGCATPSQMLVDAEVKRLCAIDGGVKVYETVKLPVDKFNQWGQINFYKPTQGENALGPEYVYRSASLSLRQGDPNLRKDHVQIFRRSDMKLFGEATTYVRGGGDLPGPWQPSAFSCPEGSIANGVVLMNKIFTNWED